MPEPDYDPGKPGVTKRIQGGPAGSPIISSNATGGPAGMSRGDHHPGVNNLMGKQIRSKTLNKNAPDGVASKKQYTEAKVADRQGDNDWRVSISIPPIIKQLNSPLLQPLLESGERMIFPFTPSVIFSHSASYSSMQPVHTNYPFYNYQNSNVDAITVSGDFFIETNEDAKYWVAAVTFLRTLTKMFYGDNGSDTGNPPPIVKFNGYGEYVFKSVPCVITSFNVDMPQDVDYMKTNIQGAEAASTGNENAPGTWVPAQSLMAVTLQPIYSRSHVEQFSLNDFVSGSLISSRGFV